MKREDHEFRIIVLGLTMGVSFIASTSPLHAAENNDAQAFDLQRVTTIAPFPRGLAMVDANLYVLCRGRVRGAGGVSAAVKDQAGTIYVVDPDVGEPVAKPEVGEAVRNNGRVFALPTDPPFNLWDRSSTPPESDRVTDRPYCVLRYHEGSKNFFLCAFSGIDMPKKEGEVSFSKNLTDALFRYDTRTEKWHEVERHDIAAGGSYPHHDPTVSAPPHGWLNGPDNCLTIQSTLYAVAKDNNRLVRYDLGAIVDDPEAGAPPSRVVLDSEIELKGIGKMHLYGHSALAAHDGWLYVATRTSSVIFRIRLNDKGLPVEPIVGEVVARFEPYDPKTMESANITDIDIDDKGRVYVVSAKPSRLYRFTPDPRNIFDGIREGPWVDLAAMTNNPRMKSENVLIDGRRVFVTSGDGYTYQAGASGTVYRLTIPD